VKNINIQLYGDKAAISLSSLCIIHCLVFPFIVLMSPAFGASWFSSESFHLWMLIGVVLSSVVALTLGYLKHEQKRILIWAGIGLILLFIAFLLEEHVSELVGKVITIFGAVAVGVGHYKNYTTCGKQNCECN